MAKESAPAAKKKSPTSSNPPPSTSTFLHPPYLQMISEAISSLKDRTGSSQPAIAKFIEEKYQKQLPPNFKKIISVQLKKFVKSEKLVKVKNSYKISATEKGKSIAASAKLTGATIDVKKKEKKKKNVTAPVISVPTKAAKKVLEKAVKMKRLSQVKTPEALKKNKSTTAGSAKKSGEKVKKLEKDKSPDGAKKKKKEKEKEKVSEAPVKEDLKPVKSSRAATKKSKG